MIVPVRKHAFAALVRAIEKGVPELKGKVKVEADRGKDMTWPSLGIRCIKAPLKRYPRRKVTRQGGATVFDCGHFEALVQLRLGAPTEAQRRDLGELVQGVFLGDGENAGRLVTAIDEVPGFSASWDMDEDAWGDEMAFTDKWWSVATVTGLLPAVVRFEVPTIETVRLDFADELAPTESLFVLEDGSLSLTSPI